MGRGAMMRASGLLSGRRRVLPTTPASNPDAWPVMITVSSSNLAKIGYDIEQNILYVEYLDGAVYRWFDVETDLHAQLIRAASHGQYLSRRVIGRYSSEQLRARDS